MNLKTPAGGVTQPELLKHTRFECIFLSSSLISSVFFSLHGAVLLVVSGGRGTSPQDFAEYV
jgi:hypothetical protein